MECRDCSNCQRINQTQGGCKATLPPPVIRMHPELARGVVVNLSDPADECPSFKRPMTDHEWRSYEFNLPPLRG